MTNPSKQKGTAFETALVDYLRTAGAPHAERRALAGNKDLGDITGVPGLCIEAKACKTMALAEWMAELEVEAVNACASTAAIVHKRRGKSIAQAYVTMDLTTYCALLRDAGYLVGSDA